MGTWQLLELLSLVSSKTQISIWGWPTTNPSILHYLGINVYDSKNKGDLAVQASRWVPIPDPTSSDPPHPSYLIHVMEFGGQVRMN